MLSLSQGFFCWFLLLQVFSDQLLLQDVLARSDRAMAVVKDLFGDAPRRQTGRKLLIHSCLTVIAVCDVENYSVPCFLFKDVRLD